MNMTASAADRLAAAREHARALDRDDPLAPLAHEFVQPKDTIYLDGNSLGMLPKGALPQMRRTLEDEWGQGLIRSWVDTDWYRRVSLLGDRIGRLIGAAGGQTIVVDTTSLNLFKVLVAALRLAPGRKRIVSEASNFPTDLYMVHGVRELFPGTELVLAGRDGTLDELVDANTACVLLTQVDFRTGARHDMAAVTRRVQAQGALMIWDLAHSAGAFPVELDACKVDFAVGCTYKYLNAGPGAPAFVYCAERHQRHALQPLTGWMSHADPFEFGIDYRPAEGMQRFLCGTQPVIASVPLAASLDIWEKTDLHAVRRKSVALCERFIEWVEWFAADHGLVLASPRDAGARGSQVSFRHAHGFAIMRALIAQGVVGDFRAPDILRFGFTPLTLSYEQVLDAAIAFERIMASSAWRSYSNARTGGVT